MVVEDEEGGGEGSNPDLEEGEGLRSRSIEERRPRI